MIQIISRAFLAVILLSKCIVSFAESPTLDVESALKRGIAAVKNDDRKNAIHYLLPLAKSGNAEAMYYLGAMFVEASDIPGHLDKTEKLLSESYKRGFYRAQLLLERVSKQQQINDGTYVPPSSIAGHRTPSKEELAKMERRAQRSMAKIKRNTPKQASKAQVEVNVFVDKPDSTLDTIIEQQQRLDTLYPGKTKFNYHIVLKTLTPFSELHKQRTRHKIPNDGFIPDVHGSISREFGIDHYPGVIISTQQSRKTLESPALLSRTVANIIREGLIK